MVESNKMLDKLRAGGIAVGTQIRSRSPQIAELIGYAGFDFVYIESEHFPFNEETVEELVRGCDLANVTSLIRLPDGNENLIMHYLDMGLGGLIVPHIDTAEAARALVMEAKYAPMGQRGFTDSSRSAKYGFLGIGEHRELSNRNTAIIPMIESREAYNNIDAILDSGVDLIRIGLRDLSDSFGYRGEQNHEDLQRTVDDIIARATRRNIAVGCACGSLADVREKLNRGFRQISFLSDLGMLKMMAMDSLAQLRKMIQEGEKQ